MAYHDRIGEAEAQFIVNTYKKTKSTKKTAEIVGRSLPAVQKQLQKHGIELQKWLKTSDRRKIPQVYRQTMSMRKTGKIIGCSARTVSRMLQIYGIPAQKQGVGGGTRISSEQRKEMRELALEGYSAKTIRELLGISSSAVQKHLTLMGISLLAVRQRMKEKLDEEYD